MYWLTTIKLGALLLFSWHIPGQESLSQKSKNFCHKTSSLGTDCHWDWFHQSDIRAPDQHLCDPFSFCYVLTFWVGCGSFEVTSSHNLFPSLETQGYKEQSLTTCDLSPKNILLRTSQQYPLTSPWPYHMLTLWQGSPCVHVSVWSPGIASCCLKNNQSSVSK